MARISKNNFTTLIKRYYKNPYVICTVIIFNAFITFLIVHYTSDPSWKNVVWIFWDNGTTCIAFVVGYYLNNKVKNEKRVIK